MIEGVKVDEYTIDQPTEADLPVKAKMNDQIIWNNDSTDDELSIVYEKGPTLFRTVNENADVKREESEIIDVTYEEDFEMKYEMAQPKQEPHDVENCIDPRSKQFVEPTKLPGGNGHILLNKDCKDEVSSLECEHFPTLCMAEVMDKNCIGIQLNSIKSEEPIEINGDSYEDGFEVKYEIIQPKQEPQSIENAADSTNEQILQPTSHPGRNDDRPSLVCNNFPTLNKTQNNMSATYRNTLNHIKSEEPIEIIDDSFEDGFEVKYEIIPPNQEPIENVTGSRNTKMMKPVLNEVKYDCPHCSNSYRSKKSLSNHCSLKHRQNNVENDKNDVSMPCLQCNKKFKSQIILRSHVRNEHPATRHRCEICGFTSMKKSLVDEHLTTHHSSPKREMPTCKVCEKAYYCSDSNFQRHECPGRKMYGNNSHFDVSEKKLHTCNVCERTYCSKGSFERHNCSGRNIAASEFSLGRDVRSTTGKRRVRCYICLEWFSNRRYMYAHFRRAHPENLYRCEICQCLSPAKSLLKQHMLVHFGAKRFECTECPLKFNYKGNLQRHMLVHYRQTPFKCGQCPYTTTKERCLDNHIVANHGMTASTTTKITINYGIHAEKKTEFVVSFPQQSPPKKR